MEQVAAKKKKPNNNARRIARLAAMQALYQIALTKEAADAVVRRFRDDPTVFLQEDQSVSAVDIDLFSTIVIGVNAHEAELDQMLSGAVSERFSLDRMEPILKAILRAGAFELHHLPEMATGIIVNDYVDVAHGFFDAKEPGLVNAILDKLAKTLRN
jgi:N utilization substance protein B